MKNLLAAGIIVVLIMGIYSCARNVADKPQSVDCTSVDPLTNTYNLRIKTIIETNCTADDSIFGFGCHSNANAQALGGGVLLEGYTNAKATFINYNALCNIKQEQGCLPMPQFPRQKLADSLITYLQCWTENNYPQ